MKTLVIMCGPPGSGKSTYAKTNLPEFTYINQDSQGKEGHMRYFLQAIAEGEDIVVDRMSFNKQQRDNYLNPAKANGYETKIVVIHESSATCLERMSKRVGHETIQDEKSAGSALHTFMSKYERVQDSEADVVVRVYPAGNKPEAIIVDLDGTLCNIDHRLHFVQGEGRKDWKNFMYNIPGDSVNEWCLSLINAFKADGKTELIFCSGRSSNYKKETVEWLIENTGYYPADDFNLFMRDRNDHRADTIIKEIILDFEILTRFTPIFAVDDRPSVCRMWRSRDIVCLQCNEKEF